MNMNPTRNKTGATTESRIHSFSGNGTNGTCVSMPMGLADSLLKVGACLLKAEASGCIGTLARLGVPRLKGDCKLAN